MYRVALALASASSCAVAWATTFPQLITDFEQNGAGVAYPIQKASLNDLQVVMFQDPAQALVTRSLIRADSLAIYSSGDPNMPSTEESFVAAYGGFYGANGSAQFMDIRFQWVNPADPNRWALIETLQSPQLGDPSLDLGGKVRLYVNLPNCAQLDYPGLFTLPPEIGIALLIRETGKNVPQGFQDNTDPNNSRFEFVGVSSVADANTPNPIPVPSRLIPITDAGCEGQTTGPTGNWRLVEFNLPTENVIGWTSRGGNGVLNATDIGDGVNRGVLAGIVLTVLYNDTTSNYVEFLVDQIEFEATVADPASAPSIAVPVVLADTSVQINGIVSRATNVTLEVDRYDPNDPNNALPFVADQTYSVAPNLDPNGELHFTTIGVSPALAVGDRLRARQTVNAVVGPYSIVVTVNPPAAFSATLSLDESGSLGVVANFEWVGATAVVGTAGTQGHPVFVQNGMWQKVEFSLIPSVEPVISFAGGNGQLQPDGGLYNIDAMFFTIDSTTPNVGPYLIYLDHVYYVDPNNNEVLISNAETTNPFPNVRGQTTDDPNIPATSVLASVTSYDGIYSNRLGWTFANTAPSNTHAPYRPLVTFPDSAKAVGMWLLVEDPRTSTLPLPAVEQRIIGVAPAVTVSNIDPNATLVRLLVNGVASGSVNPAGATSVNIVPGSPLALGKQVSASYDVPSRATSDLAYPRVVQRPPAPTLPGSLVAGQTTVTVSNVRNTGNAVASLVRVLANGVQIGSKNPAGAASVVVNVTPPLALGQQITARQTVNTFESADSIAIAVGTGVHLRVVINELAYDDSGADDREFIELYNGEPNAVDISGWMVRASDIVAPPADTNADFTIPASTTLAAGGFYVIGQALVPGVNLIIANDQLTNDNEAYELLDQNGVVVDALITERNKGPVAVSPAEGGWWGNFQSYIDTVTRAPSLGRWFDGFDTNDNGRDFGIRPATPGMPNSVASLAPYTENFDGGTLASDVTNWGGTYAALKYMDPNVPGTTGNYNTGAIPRSPQGGYAGICMDSTGGGDMCALSDAARFSFAFSCYVYISADNPGFVAGNTSLEYEAWSVGMGATDGVFNIFAPYPGGTGNGNTGLQWQFLKRENADTGTILATTLQFVNRGDDFGGGGTVLLDVDPNAITTGWHMLSITRNYENVSAAYDPNTPNALTYTGTIPNLGPGALAVGYREYVVGFPATLRPPTIDAVSITALTPPTLGACCMASGCQVLTTAVCTAYGGIYMGDGTNCSPSPCPLLGACCTPAGTCSVTLQGNCTTPNTWLGAGTNCSPNLCPQPGACCTPAGACSVTLQADCTTPNTWQGAGTTCSPNNCPQPTGACCTPAGACSLTLQADCLSPNVWHGEWTACSPTNPCPQPNIGACCSTTGTCSVITQAACLAASGHYYGNNTTCRPGNKCPASCRGDMNCDGSVTFADIDLFVAALAGEPAWTHWPCPWINGDCTADGNVTFADIDPFVARIGQPCP